jgi:uncharacterized Zn finger protein (UPF0148 family)
MAIATVCPACGQKGEAPDAVQGLRLKCPTCGHTFKAIGTPSPDPASNPDSSWNSSTKEQKDLDTLKAPMPQEQYAAEPPANSAPIIPPRPPLRYPALRAIAAVNEALGFFTLILGLASIVLVLVASGTPSKEFFVYAFAWTVFVPIGFFASAQLLRVFLDIEENTRYQSMLLSALLDHVAKVQASRQPGE